MKFGSKTENAPLSSQPHSEAMTEGVCDEWSEPGIAKKGAEHGIFSTHVPSNVFSGRCRGRNVDCFLFYFFRIGCAAAGLYTSTMNNA